MNKNQLTKNLKLGGLLFLCSIFLWNCEEEDIPIEDSQNFYSTVSFEKAKIIIENFNSSKNSSRDNDEITITPDWDTQTQDEIEGIDALLTNIEAEVTSLSGSHLSTKIVFLEYEGLTYRAIETSNVSSFYDNGNIKNGTIYYHVFNGKYLDGYIIEDGIITKRLVRTDNSDNSATNRDGDDNAGEDDCDEDLDPDSEFCSETLDEIDLPSGGSSGSIIIVIINNNQHNPELIEDEGGGTSGSNGYNDNDDSTNNSCTGGKVEDSNGDCVCPEGYTEDSEGICREKPCEGDPIKNPQVAGQHGKSGTKGAFYGCMRYGGNCTGGTDGRNMQHSGMDLKNNYGDPIYAMYDGTIYSTKYDDKAGYYTRIQSTVNGETFLHVYFHLQENNRIRQGGTGSPLVQVKAGDIIGYQGNSGNLEVAINRGRVDSHVHVEIRKHDGSNSWEFNNFDLVDPRTYFSTTIDDNGVTTNSNCD